MVVALRDRGKTGGGGEGKGGGGGGITGSKDLFNSKKGE